jgi:hypothetical protein
VLYINWLGLRNRGNEIWSQVGYVNGVPNAGDRFGTALAAGDFNGNGRDDFAIGVPGEDTRKRTDAGQVNVLYGRSKGLSVRGDYSFKQGGRIAGAAENHHLLGTTLHSGDFNGDGRDALVAGVPGEDVGAVTDAGAATVLYGSTSGLRAENNQTVTGAGAVAGTPERGDGLATGVCSTEPTMATPTPTRRTWGDPSCAAPMPSWSCRRQYSKPARSIASVSAPATQPSTRASPSIPMPDRSHVASLVPAT